MKADLPAAALPAIAAPAAGPAPSAAPAQPGAAAAASIAAGAAADEIAALPADAGADDAQAAGDKLEAALTGEAPVGVKVCGIWEKPSALAALTAAKQAGADNLVLGLLMGIKHHARETLPTRQAPALVSYIRDTAHSLGVPVKLAVVTHHTRASDLLAMMETVGRGLNRLGKATAGSFAELIQIHDRMPLSEIEKVKRALPEVKLVKALHVPGPGEPLDLPTLVEEAATLAASPSVDGLLLDSANLARDQIGGTGRVNDWNAAKAVIDAVHERSGKPVALAGGLSPDNAAEAQARTGADLIDANSGYRLDRKGREWRSTDPRRSAPKDAFAVHSVLTQLRGRMSGHMARLLGPAASSSPSLSAAQATEPAAQAARARGGRPRLGRRRLSPSYRPPADGKVKVAFFDADSTLRVSLSGSVSANGPRDVMLLPWVAQKLAELSRRGYLIAIVSNQAGVGKQIKLKDADAALQYTIELIRQAGGEVHYYDFAEKKNLDRKPQTGMAVRLEKLLRREFGKGVTLDKDASLMVGDSAYARAKKGKPADRRPDGSDGEDFSNADRLFAENYGVAFHEPADFFGWRKHGVRVFTKAWQVRKFLAEHGRPGFSFDLPPIGSRAFEALAAKARAQLRETRSFAVVDLSKLIPEDLGRRWLASMPEGASSQISPDGRILQMKDSRVDVTDAGAERKAAIAALRSWVAALIARALDAETPLAEPTAQLRTGNDQDRGLDFPQWHIDGGGVSATLSILGAGTEVLGVGERVPSMRERHQGDEWLGHMVRREPFVAGRGELLIFAGGESRDDELLRLPTVHRTPAGTRERALFVFRW